jgi:hypothetical protein
MYLTEVFLENLRHVTAYLYGRLMWSRTHVHAVSHVATNYDAEVG